MREWRGETTTRGDEIGRDEGIQDEAGKGCEGKRRPGGRLRVVPGLLELLGRLCGEAGCRTAGFEWREGGGKRADGRKEAGKEGRKEGR